MKARDLLYIVSRITILCFSFKNESGNFSENVKLLSPKEKKISTQNLFECKTITLNEQLRLVLDHI